MNPILTTDIIMHEQSANDSVVLLDKRYCDDDLDDLERDISECLDARFNPLVNGIPANCKGSFGVTVTWIQSDE